MSRRPRGPSVGPKKQEWITGTLQMFEMLTEMVGRWNDGIPGQTRKELMPVRDVAERLLLRARLIK